MQFHDFAQKIADFLLRAISPRHSTVIAIVTGILLFGSRYFPSLGLDGFVRPYRPWIVVVFLFSTVLTATYPVSSGWSFGKVRLENWLRRRKTLRYLEHLPADQLAVLIKFAESGKNAERFGIYNVAIPDMIAKGILTRHEQYIAPNQTIGYTLTPIAEQFVRSASLQQALLGDAKAKCQTTSE